MNQSKADKKQSDKANEHKFKTEMIRNSTIKNLRRKNLEIMIEKQIQYQEKQRQKQSKGQVNSAILLLKTLTFGIIVRIAGAMFQSILSLGACIVYVVNTYYEDSSSDEGVFQFFEIFFATLFSVDYLLGLYNAKNKRKFFFSTLNMVDLVTILPVFVSYVPGGATTAGNSLKKFIGVVRVLRVFRVLRLYRLFMSQGPDQVKGGPFAESSEVKRKIIMISSTILAIVFISTGIIYSFNRMDIGFIIDMPDENEKLSFDSAFYFMVVTVCTVGYGDIKPGSDLARIIVGIFIIMIIVLVSKQTSELNELMKFSSQYRVPFTGQERSQIILIGNITSNTFSKFLKEFYHPDHNMKDDMKVVIIQNHEPSKEMLTVLTNPKYEESLHYIVGSIFREQVMKMGKVKENKIFILCNQYSADSKKDDTFALLATKAIHEYDPSSKIFVQLVDPEFLLHSWADWDVVMSTQAYKMGIIASNAFNPGFSTFICNLIMSTSVSSNIKKKFPDWVVEYCNGLSQEFYCVPFSKDQQSKYVGKTFSHAVDQIYFQHGILLIGVRSLSNSDQNEIKYHDILMNPINYVIKPTDEAIIISRNQESASIICEDGPTGVTINQYFNQNVGIVPFLITEEKINEMNLSKQVSESVGTMNSDHYYMWETDLRGVIKNHFIVFGQMDHLPALLLALKHYTNQHICFVSDKQPDERWSKLRRNFPNVIYLESSLSDVEELGRTAIEESFHVILLTWFVADSSIQDSGILPIVRIIEENFKTVSFTLELVDESNLKYLNFRPKKELGNISFNIWPRYASSNVFFSSTMDYLMAQAYHSESIVEIVGKLINSNISPNISGVEENNEINVMKLPAELVGTYRYIDLFQAMIRQRRHIIPLAIVRGKTENENEIPYVLINPQPLAPIQKDDLLLMMGNIQGMEINGLALIPERVADDLNEQMKESLQTSKANQAEDQISTTDDLIELAKQYICPHKLRLIEEDEALNVADPILQKKLEEDRNITPKDREILLKQNEEMRKLLKEYHQIRKRVFNKQ